MSVEQVYDLEGIIEASVASVLTNAELTTATTETASKFQSTRPRLEVMAIIGPGRLRYGMDTSGGRRECAWSSQIKVEVITPADIAIHRSYRAQARNAMATVMRSVNGVERMTLHKIQNITDAGASPVRKPEDGIFVTSLLYNLEISVQANAWAALET